MDYYMETIMTVKNYNRLAMSGLEVTDMELVEEYNLDPALAGTPKINDAMLDVIEQKNIKAMINDGYTEKKARAMAGRLKARAKHEIIKDMRK